MDLNLIMMLMDQLLLLYTTPLFVNGSVFGPLATPQQQLIHFTVMQCSFAVVHGLSIYNTVFAGWPYGLFIDGAKGDSPAQATNNILQIEKSVMAGMTTNYVTTYLATTEAWYLDASRGNEIKATNDLLMLTVLLTLQLQISFQLPVHLC